ncbi:orotidine 5'-phosphate decarboxylase / HUMPS family protein [Amycolatopsis sp. cmx-11-12]|uniref:orotidine 5'-phosphate decarboxylase / HUMPS family protein n=1 Tax=Amycolatopsis sp. cmx-11-12 TaxID=2785795 RepID=UPI003917BD62
MSVREFAGHLGFNDAAVSNWESRGEKAKLRTATQQVLDTDLSLAPEDVRERFELALAAGQTPHGELGVSSRARTDALLNMLTTQQAAEMPYRPPPGAIQHVRRFLASSSRVCAVTGPAGSGKTHLTYHLATELSTEADVQLLAANSWDLPGLDLAVEILRYASIPRQHDALLTLEAASSAASRTCVVIVDGISSQVEFNEIGRHIDTILRQVTSPSLRFMLVMRTPPDIETAPYPVLTAALFDPPGQHEPGGPFMLGSWNLVETQAAWDAARTDEHPAFADLPTAVQELIRLPLYMQLVLAAKQGSTTSDGNAYTLIDHCVRTILREDGQDADQALAALADIAERKTPNLIPANIALDVPREQEPEPQQQPRLGSSAAALTRVTATGDIEFAHDVLREFALATRIASVLRTRGRSIALVNALNALAAHAHNSATARNIFELAISCLDDTARDLVTEASMAPTISTHTTLPMMLRIAAQGARFANREVLRTCARRSDTEAGLELAQALLMTPDVYPALGPDANGWLLGLLRRFGSKCWNDAKVFVEQNLNAAGAYALLDTADLAEGEEATFFARHFFLFFGDIADLTGPLEVLLNQRNWRVRAALAEGLRDDHAPTNATSQAVFGRLVHDRDYKVRAAAALALPRASRTAAHDYLRVLLADENWHVRERVLHGLLSQHVISVSRDPLIAEALAVVKAEPTWAQCPIHVHTILQRLRILHAPTVDAEESNATARALFSILRESRTGWANLTDPARAAIVTRGQQSTDWLVRREADGLATELARGIQPGRSAISDPRSHRETFRRRRGHRALQVALDIHNLDDAIRVAQAAAAAGVDFIEVGDPLIKEVGLRAIEQIKMHVPETTVIAEMMSADWGRDQVVLAAEAGADVVLLIGPASTASVSAAVEAGRRLGIPIMLDAPTTSLSQQWVSAMERAGVDGFTITTNIDIGIASTTSLTTARRIRSWTQLPVAVSGGFSPADHAIIASPDWDILIVGRSVADAVDPATAAQRIAELVHSND